LPHLADLVAVGDVDRVVSQIAIVSPWCFEKLGAMLICDCRICSARLLALSVEM
jgi:hypothetical protein